LPVVQKSPQTIESFPDILLRWSSNMFIYMVEIAVLFLPHRDGSKGIPLGWNRGVNGMAIVVTSRVVDPNPEKCLGLVTIIVFHLPSQCLH